MIDFTNSKIIEEYLLLDIVLPLDLCKIDSYAFLSEFHKVIALEEETVKNWWKLKDISKHD